MVIIHLCPLVGAGADVTSIVKGLQVQTRSLTRASTDMSGAIPSPRTVRTYETAALRQDGSLQISQTKAYAFPFLDAAFTAFARGTLLATPDGDVAIEDLQPGDRVDTSTGEAAEVTWIGSVRLASQLRGERTPLVRIMADTFGPARPSSFVTAGPSARILRTPFGMRNGAPQSTEVLTPVNAFVDGVNVIEIVPPTPVQLFHICLTRHAAVNAGGVEMETFHPGMAESRMLTHAQREFFLSLFPCINHITDFGPLAHPRAQEHSLDAA